MEKNINNVILIKQRKKYNVLLFNKMKICD